MKIENQTFEEERALYALHDSEVTGCVFEGEADGESALKESRRIRVGGCRFLLRYPFWHSEDYQIDSCYMAETARAALWYCKNGKLTDCELNGIKALRECENTEITGCRVVSPEFGWKCRGVHMADCRIESEYFLLDSKDIRLENTEMRGKYSFQYTENVTVENCVLDTKDAFWHTKNATVRDCVIKGEYLGWYSDSLTLINCRITGTQPFCYCKNLTLIGCTMENTDLAFEYSDVSADIRGEVLSVKNPASGSITADGFGEIVTDGAVMPCRCEIIVR